MDPITVQQDAPTKLQCVDRLPDEAFTQSPKRSLIIDQRIVALDHKTSRVLLRTRWERVVPPCSYCLLFRCGNLNLLILE